MDDDMWLAMYYLASTHQMCYYLLTYIITTTIDDMWLAMY
jgi:hypothetical protein